VLAAVAVATCRVRLSPLLINDEVTLSEPAGIPAPPDFRDRPSAPEDGSDRQELQDSPTSASRERDRERNHGRHRSAEPRHKSGADRLVVPRVTRIAPARRVRLPDLRELYYYRELLYLLTWRDITLRYKQTFLGASWAILQPVLGTVVFTVFFHRVGKIPSEGVPYPVFALVGLVPWTFFSNGLLLGSNSLIMNYSLITKIYFPRLLIPLATILAGLLDLLVASAVLAGLMAWYGIAPGWSVLWMLPLLILVTVLATAGVTTWLAALNVRYRDVRFVVPFLAQLWLFATPIAYPASLVPSRWRVLEGLNPMAGVVEGFRAVLLPTHLNATPIVVVSSLSAVVMFLGGILYFYQVERTFADVI
jgi:homopolymeric O-antigen transport system permease protein